MQIHSYKFTVVSGPLFELITLPNILGMNSGYGYTNKNVLAEIHTQVNTGQDLFLLHSWSRKQWDYPAVTAMLKGKVVALVFLDKHTFQPDPKYTKVHHSSYVVPGLRGLGVAHALHQKLREYLDTQPGYGNLMVAQGGSFCGGHLEGLLELKKEQTECLHQTQ